MKSSLFLLAAAEAETQKKGVVQKLLISGNTFLDIQQARSRETEGFGLVALFQECNPRLNHAASSTFLIKVIIFD